jgi:hypothetical protein
MGQKAGSLFASFSLCNGGWLSMRLKRKIMKTTTIKKTTINIEKNSAEALTNFSPVPDALMIFPSSKPAT